jgi:hypothetical protein
VRLIQSAGYKVKAITSGHEFLKQPEVLFHAIQNALRQTTGKATKADRLKEQIIIPSIGP